MWNKILEINWKTRFGDQRQEDEPIEGTNGATVGTMKGINDLMRIWLTAVEVPVFVAAVLAILHHRREEFLELSGQISD